MFFSSFSFFISTFLILSSKFVVYVKISLNVLLFTPGLKAFLFFHFSFVFFFLSFLLYYYLSHFLFLLLLYASPYLFFYLSFAIQLFFLLNSLCFLILLISFTLFFLRQTEMSTDETRSYSTPTTTNHKAQSILRS